MRIKEIYIKYILCDDLSNKDIFELENMSCDFVEVKCILFNDNLEIRYVTEHIHLSKTAVFRLFVPDYLNQYEKIIYLDTDVIVCDDISKLLFTNLENRVIGVSKCQINDREKYNLRNYVENTVGVRFEEYFNSGVMLIDVKKFKANKVKEKSLKILSCRKDLLFMDQDALNIVLKNNVFFISKEWNYECGILFDIFHKTDCNYDTKFSIIHYDGIVKPWQYPIIHYDSFF